LIAAEMLHHCWHDVRVKFPGGPGGTLESPGSEGRVCCYCGDLRPEPLPPPGPRRSHGPHVDDDSEWYVVDEAECPGPGVVKLEPKPAVISIHPDHGPAL
jgi:hypothetical protein